MDFGIGIASSHDSWKVAQRAEELGFTHAWFYDTQMITADVFIAMAGAAMKTSRIRIGFAVVQTPFHHPVRLAVQLALLDNLRIDRYEGRL